MVLSLFRFYWACILLILLFCASCQKLDEDGGYFDEKTGVYKYVSPRRDMGKSSAYLSVKNPRAGEQQQIQGAVAQIGSDLKSVWIYIESRQVYMILAESAAKGIRNDKEKKIRLDLQYVAPNSIAVRKREFRQQWREYVGRMLESQLLNQTVLADIEYRGGSRRFRAVVYRVVKTKQGDRIRNINLWMIRQGLSYYIVDRGLAPRHKEFSKAQELARKSKAGIWQYK